MRSALLLAPLSQPRFDRFAKGYRLSSFQVSAVVVAGAVVAAVFVGLAALLLGTLAEYYYLETFGLEAVAATTRSSTHISEGRHHVVTKWEKLDYNFTAADGPTVESVVDRPVAELADVGPDRFAVVYWRLFPSVNVPKELRPENAVICALALLLLLAAGYFALFANRALQFQRTLSQENVRGLGR